MQFTSIVLGIVFTVAGFLFACGKLHIHLSNWKNMPEEEKESIDIVPLCHNVGAIITLSGLIFLAKGVWIGFYQHLVYPYDDCMVCGGGLGSVIY